MKLEDQVVSLELAKKLKELGVKQDSLFGWFLLKEKAKKLHEDKDWGIAPMFRLNDEAYKVRGFMVGKEIISAFTAVELGEMLPTYIEVDGDRAWRTFNRVGYWEISYTHTRLNESKVKTPVFQSHSEADLRAQMLIYLIDHGLLKLTY